jgi:SAM-dependent methyltransferase
MRVREQPTTGREVQMGATAVEAWGDRWATQEGRADCDADALPFADESFDYVLSWNVIFHGTMGDVGRRLAEIWRVLKPGGLFQGTMLSKRDVQFGRGRAIAPDTFIRGSDPKAHPHFYCDLAGLAVLFAGFELLSLTQEEQRRPGSWHWHILVERR